MYLLGTLLAAPLDPVDDEGPVQPADAHKELLEADVLSPEK